MELTMYLIFAVKISRNKSSYNCWLTSTVPYWTVCFFVRKFLSVWGNAQFHIFLVTN